MNAEETPSGRKHILVVDDNQTVLAALTLSLKTKYEVSTAVDGASAISAFRKQRPDLILMDILFPPDVAHGGGVAWDGFVIIDWLRRMESASDIPVFIITGVDPAKYMQRAAAAGVVEVFHKPIDNDELLAAIDRVLGGAAPAQPATDAAPGPVAS